MTDMILSVLTPGGVTLFLVMFVFWLTCADIWLNYTVFKFWKIE